LHKPGQKTPTSITGFNPTSQVLQYQSLPPHGYTIFCRCCYPPDAVPCRKRWV